jgi:cell division protein ZipA
MMEDLTIRDWMVLIGAGLILAVLVDAARRVWRERRAEVRLNAKITRADLDDREDEPFNLLAELPNGGARIVARDDLQPRDSAPEADSFDDADPLSFSATETSEERELSPIQASASDRSDANLADPDDSIEPDQPLVEHPAAETHIETAAAEREAPSPDVDTTTPKASKRGRLGRRGKTTSPPDEDAPETLDWLEALDTEAQPAAEARLPRDIEPHVFVLNVVARAPEGFAGSDILQILLACDLRFGDMDFFHRHESASGRGPIQFSVANMMNPGVFDIDAMDQLRTRGLMFFVTLPGPENMLQAFDYMYETAKTVARNLDGDVLDDNRSAITRQTLEHMRQQIRELERRMMVGRER